MATLKLDEKKSHLIFIPHPTYVEKISKEKKQSLIHYTKPSIRRFDLRQCETPTASHNVTKTPTATHLSTEPSTTHRVPQKNNGTMIPSHSLASSGSNSLGE
jgi:hypothetical protein